MTTHCQADTGRLKRVALRHPRLAFASQLAIDKQWRQLGFTAAPELRTALAEYDAFEQILRSHDITIDYLPDTVGTGLDSIYVRDASVLCERGAILCRMGKKARRGEPAAHGELYASLGIPVLGTIEPPGTLEGGDVAWLDRRTVAVGHGYRTNAAGIDQQGVLGVEGGAERRAESGTARPGVGEVGGDRLEVEVVDAVRSERQATDDVALDRQSRRTDEQRIPLALIEHQPAPGEHLRGLRDSSIWVHSPLARLSRSRIGASF